MPALSTPHSGVPGRRQETPRRRSADRHYLAVVATEARRLARQLRSSSSARASHRERDNAQAEGAR